MAKGYKKGSNGIFLNFKIIKYLSESLLNEAKPAENTIGVITSDNITGWYFTDSQPDNMVDGEIWIRTGNISNVPFNVLKKNNITVYPKSAKQMVSGQLKDVTSKIYRNGKWIDIFSGTYLFYVGDQCIDITGGWSHASNKFTPGTISNGAINLVTGEEMSTNKAIMKGQNTKLCIEAENVTGEISVVLTTVRGDYSGYTAIYSGIITKNGEEKFDISEVDVPFYLAMYAYSTGTIKAVKVWME